MQIEFYREVEFRRGRGRVGCWRGDKRGNEGKLEWTMGKIRMGGERGDNLADGEIRQITGWGEQGRGRRVMLGTGKG